MVRRLPVPKMLEVGVEGMPGGERVTEDVGMVRFFSGNVGEPGQEGELR